MSAPTRKRSTPATGRTEPAVTQREAPQAAAFLPGYSRISTVFIRVHPWLVPLIGPALTAMAVAVMLAFAGCSTSPAAAPTGEAQIRERIASIRASILAKNPDGIVAWGTPDWSFTGPDAKTYDRAAYLVRTRGLMDRLVAVHSLDTAVDKVEFHGDTADVELTQTMERSEKDAASGVVTRVWLRYRSDKYFGEGRTPPGGRGRS